MEFVNACDHKNGYHSVECYAWMRRETDAQDRTIITADDAQGKIDFARKEERLNNARSVLRSGKMSIEDLSQIFELAVSEVELLKKEKI